MPLIEELSSVENVLKYVKSRTKELYKIIKGLPSIKSTDLNGTETFPIAKRSKNWTGGYSYEFSLSQLVAYISTAIGGGGTTYTPGQNITIDISNVISSDNLVDILFDDFVALADTQSYVPNTWYRITDYRTIYDQPDYDSSGATKTTVVLKTGEVQPLLIYASGNAALDLKHVVPTDQAEDVLWYVPFITETTYSESPTKGYYRGLKDGNLNETDYDFRVVKYKRYESSPASGIFSEWKDNGGTSQEFFTFNTLSGFNFLHSAYDNPGTGGVPFDLSNIVFMGVALNNYIGYVCANITFIAEANQNKIGEKCQDLTFFGVTKWNEIGNDSRHVFFLGQALENKLRGKLTDVTAGDVFTGNLQEGTLSSATFGNHVTYCKFYGMISNIILGNTNSRIEVSNSSDITIGSNNLNIVVKGCASITSLNVLSNIANLTMEGINGAAWTEGITPTAHPEVYAGSDNKSVVKGSDGNYYVKYFDGTSEQYSAIT